MASQFQRACYNQQVKSGLHLLRVNVFSQRESIDKDLINIHVHVPWF